MLSKMVDLINIVDESKLPNHDSFISMSLFCKTILWNFMGEVIIWSISQHFVALESSSPIVDHWLYWCKQNRGDQNTLFVHFSLFPEVFIIFIVILSKYGYSRIELRLTVSDVNLCIAKRILRWILHWKKRRFFMSRFIQFFPVRYTQSVGIYFISFLLFPLPFVSNDYKLWIWHVIVFLYQRFSHFMLCVRCGMMCGVYNVHTLCLYKLPCDICIRRKFALSTSTPPPPHSLSNHFSMCTVVKANTAACVRAFSVVIFAFNMA